MSPGVVDGLDELLAADLVAVLAGLDEVVERDLERLPDLAELAGHVVDVGLGRDPEFLGALRDLDRVLVVAHLEVDGVPFHPAEPRLDVGPDLLEGRADVRPAVGVVDRRRDVEPGRVALAHRSDRLPIGSGTYGRLISKSDTGRPRDVQPASV